MQMAVNGHLWNRIAEEPEQTTEDKALATIRMEARSLCNILLAELECLSCGKYMVSEIFYCPNGHNICSHCHSITTNCVTCKEPLDNARNLFLEKIAASVTFPCLYQKAGCRQMLSKQNITVHQENCFHGPNRCPWFSSESCLWQGTAEELQAHVQQKHGFLEADIVGSFTTQCISVKDGQRWELLFSAGKESFFRVFVNKDGDFYGYIKYLGPAEKAKLFRYKMHLQVHKPDIHFGKDKITSTFRGPMHTWKMLEESIVKSGSCFRVSHHTLINLLEKELELCIETSIHT